MRSYSILVCSLFALLAAREPAFGQAAPPPAESAEQAIRSGNFDQARAVYRALMESTGGKWTESTSGYFASYAETGDYAEGLAEINTYLKQDPENPYLLHMQGRLLAATGRYSEAETSFHEAARRKNDYWGNTLELGRLMEQMGRRQEAMGQYVQIYRAYKAGQFRSAETLGMAGQAAARLAQFHDANNAFRTAYQAEPGNIQNLRWWAELFHEKYNDADARRTYEEALDLHPHHAPLFVGYAQTVGNFALQEELAKKALAVNPRSVEALNLMAELRILDGLYEQAGAFLDEALSVNPASVSTLAHLASIQNLQGNLTFFQDMERRALAINPHPADFYLTISENLTRRFRYPDAARMARQALSADPESVEAYAALGAALLRLGERQEARRYLQVAFEQDPFNLFVGNTLTLLDEYENFGQLESEHFTLILPEKERDVLGLLILDLAEACYDSLSARYPYRPAGKILIEAYSDHDDFAVRIAGIPHLGLLGVSFGDVVAFDTPRAQAGSEHNWARTLWHELAHTMAIGASNHHVPRWFTEGLSVYEEQRARPEWGREMDLKLFSALDQGKLLPLTQMDRGFTRPEFPGQVLLSYYHASKIIGFITDQHGFAAIAALLSALGNGSSIETAITQVLQQSPEALDRAFMAHLRNERNQFAPALRGLPDILAQEGEEESAFQKPEAGAESGFLQSVQQGQALLRDGKLESAEAQFRKAIEIYPGYIGAGNPYTYLADLYRQQGNEANLKAILEDFLRISEYGAEAARELGNLHQKNGNREKALYYWRRSLEVEPYDLPTRERLAASLEQAGAYAEASAESRAALALNPVDKPAAYYRLARALYLKGEIQQAKRAVLQSLELAPGYRDAQKLLLQCVDGS